MSALTRPPKRPILHLLKRVTQGTVLFSGTYITAIWVASNHPEYEKYVPYGNTVIDFLEERDFQSKLSQRVRKLKEEDLNHSFYYRKLEASQAATLLSPPSSSSPSTSSSSASKPADSAVSSITSALATSTSSVSSLTSRLDEEISPEDREKEESRQRQSRATSALNSKDPLAPSRFFDAVSGTVGQGRDYLPLVLLPDESDEDIIRVAMSLNDLISSINASVVTEDSVLSVTRTLEELARAKAQIKPRYADALLVRSQHFDALHQSYRLLWDEYLDAQASSDANPAAAKATNSVLAEYSHRLAREVTDTEMLLVKLCNSTRDMEMTEEEKDQQHQIDRYRYSKDAKIRAKEVIAATKAKALAAAQEEAAAPVVTTSTKTATEAAPATVTPAEAAVSSSSSSKARSASQKAKLDPKYYGAIEPSDISLKLELALTLLVNALQQHSSVPLGPYIQGVREAVDYGTLSVYKTAAPPAKLIHDALQAISVPSDVDLAPVLDDIIASYDEEHKHM